MFTLGTDWSEIIVRSMAVYLAVLIVANVVQNAMIGSDMSLLGGLIAAATLFTFDRLFGKYL